LDPVILPKPKSIKTKGDDIEDIVQKPEVLGKFSVEKCGNKEGTETVKKDADKDPKHRFIRNRIFFLGHLKQDKS